MLPYKYKTECCGCSACVDICNKNAISMKPDHEGFLYPVINKDLCIECGLCEYVCAFKKNDIELIEPNKQKVFAARHKSIDILNDSRSGGIFVAISDFVLDQCGVIYGVGYKDHFRVAHKRAETKIERDEFRGSKYVQSDPRGIFNNVIIDLNNNSWVLFSGTPCYTAALISLLRQKKIRDDKLILCDIVCHGVPSPTVWKDYLVYLEFKYKQKAIAVNFRDKKFGWDSHYETFLFSNKKEVKRNTFAYLFSKSIMFRPSCGVCRYTRINNRPSDITLGDYWGYQNHFPDFDPDNKGVSLIIINSPKGKMIFNRINNALNYIPSSVEKCMQHNLKAPTIISDNREPFWQDYIEHGFVYVCKKYGNLGFKNLVRRATKKVMRKIKK